MTKLITTNQELQNYLPVAYTSSFERVAPFIQVAERRYIRSLIGKQQFEVFVQAYNDAGKDLDAITDPVIREAISFCQAIATNMGYLLAVPSLSLMIGETGFQVFSNSDTKQAFKWQIDELKTSLLELGFAAIEDLLVYLEDSPDIFSAYMNSSNYLENESYLIQTAAQFSAYFNIGGSRYVYYTIRYIMMRIEMQTVIPLYGEEFFESLKTDDLEGKRKELAEKYLMPGIALLTGAKAIVERIITLKNGIASINLQGNYESEKNNIPATREQTKDTFDQLTADGSKFLQDGLAFITANPEDFPGYQVPAARRRFRVANDRNKGLYIP